MENPCADVILYGTEEPSQVLRKVKAGPLSLIYSPNSLRRISWHDTELVRGISWPIRDENWGTYAPVILDEDIEEKSEKFSARLRFSVADGRLECEVSVTARAMGELRAEITMTPGKQAPNGSFLTNRAGLTVLHPIKGTAGTALEVNHSDGKNELTEFPRLILFKQPVQDIKSLAHTVNGVDVKIAFEGEVFEMEDQRNWSDASYKTYCVPLVFPFTYAIEKPVTQSVTITCSGTGPATESATRSPLQVEVTERLSLQPGLVLKNGWQGRDPVQKLVARTGVSQLTVRFGSDTDGGFFSDCARLSSLLNATTDMEIVLDGDESVEQGLLRAAEKLNGAGIKPTRILALPRAYLASHQPSGPWPEGETPIDAGVVASSVFPTAQIGGGMMTNFTELNRCRPDPSKCDYITHGTTAIVHAGDDMSVIETLDSLPIIFDSAKKLAGNKPYRLGLVSIGMRSNPYGDCVADNPTQVRRTMAHVDPRHRGLFGAAWAVGALAATEGSDVESLCLGAPVGPFGIVHVPQEYPQAGYKDVPIGVYPLYHVVRAACEMAGKQRLSFKGLPDGIAAYGVQLEDDKACFAMFANISDESKSLPLEKSASIVCLNVDTFTEAILDADWLDNMERQSVKQLELGQFNIAFAKWSE